MDISVVIPAYNEIERLPPTLAKIEEYLRKNYASWEIIVSDDGSTDDSLKTIPPKFPAVRFLSGERNMGKGAAVRRGMLASSGALALFSDADLSTPIEELAHLQSELEAKRADIAIASRALPESVIEVHQRWYRETAGRMFNILIQSLMGLPFKDTQCGFKLFRREAAHSVFRITRSDRWAFDVEALMVASSLGYSIVEVPVHWINERRGSKVHLLTDGPRMIADILRFRWWRMTGRYEKATREVLD